MPGWASLFDRDHQPGFTAISNYVHNPLWAQINNFLVQGYQVQPALSYSSCSGQPGWNVKYQKAGRSLCTLYPMQGYFIALVVIGTKEQVEAELMLFGCTAYTQKLWKKSAASPMGRWLMMEITTEEILEDAKKLIQLRRKIKSVS